MKLPQGWKEVELGEILDNKKFAIVDGPFGTQLHASDYTETGIPVVRIKNITKKDDFDEYDLVFISKNKFAELKRSAIYPGDIILAKTGATIGKVCLLPNTIPEALIASSCAKISVNKNLVSPIYVKIFLSTDMGQKQIIALSGGSTRSSINLTPLKKLKIPLPPLPIQKKIVEKLEKAEKIKQKREEADELTREYLKSVFNNIFGHQGFEEVKLGNENLFKIKGGKRLSLGERFSDEKTNRPYLRVTDMRNKTVIKENLKYISESVFKKIENYTISCEDIYITIAGTIGLSGTVPKELDGASLTENAAKIIIVNKSKISKLFLVSILSSEYVQNQIRSRIGAVGVPKLALFRIGTINIPLPPISLQQKFAKIVENVEKIKEKQKQSKEHIDELFDSLMQKAFSGRLI